jgi:hypothetical protein
LLGILNCFFSEFSTCSELSIFFDSEFSTCLEFSTFFPTGNSRYYSVNRIFRARIPTKDRKKDATAPCIIFIINVKSAQNYGRRNGLWTAMWRRTEGRTEGWSWSWFTHARDSGARAHFGSNFVY